MRLFATLLFATSLIASAFARPIGVTTDLSASCANATSSPVDTANPTSSPVDTANPTSSPVDTANPTNPPVDIAKLTHRSTSVASSTNPPVPTTTSPSAPITTTTSSSAHILTTTDSSASCTPDFLCGPQYGDGTFYGTGLGACGVTNKDTEFIVAVSHVLFDSYPGYNPTLDNPNNNTVCGRKITAGYGGKSVIVTVTDRCGGCNETSLDFSPAAFQVLAPESVGRLHDVEWTWTS
ncbi:RlpA-like double-psi beta-barrel-protein domain-containing protein-containing protein [Russula ochroleuca]|uniref:RlpA-like double-psi beta-barrel-protein domain-containing protein-containing protein n=1 Tax=Russula ochroleuca TaxID=152965 RepID=A0A9P5T9P3_9AGAM|nr:RlpA-like double-psi beta-barrel-protein domain-containing protein-containing protein [Russula ochroleuca]